MPSVATSNPSTLARPEVAGNNPRRILIRVDLPAPFAPTRPTIPGWSSKLSWSRAVTALYRLVRFSIEIIMAARAYRRSRPCGWVNRPILAISVMTLGYLLVTLVGPVLSSTGDSNASLSTDSHLSAIRNGRRSTLEPSERGDGVRAKDTLGRYGEELAVAHLRAQGLQILERNWRCRLGEIDVVAVDGDCLVVCEVKTRSSLAAGTPFEAVTRAKVSRLRRLTAAWRADQKRHFEQIRIDVVGVLQPPHCTAVIDHLKGVC